jgi:uncharacterized membrane protein YesL
MTTTETTPRRTGALAALNSVKHDTWASIISLVYLVMMVNFSLVVAALPFVAVLVTTDPTHSWPLIAATAPLAAPSISAAAATFTAYGQGETAVARTFWRAWRTTWLKSAALGAMATALVVVVLVDVKAVSTADFALAVVPALAVVLLLAAVVTMLGLVALGQVPTARLRDVIKASLYLGLRRWYLSALSLVVLATEALLFTTMPALAMGITAAPALYVAWTNSRHTLLPVLTDTEDPKETR